MDQSLLGEKAAPEATLPTSPGAGEHLEAYVLTCQDVYFGQVLSAVLADTWSFLATAEIASQHQPASSSLYFSKPCFPNQIYIFKNPSDNHKPKELPLLWGLIRRNCLSSTSKSLALNFSAAREGSRRMSGGRRNLWTAALSVPLCPLQQR